MDKMMILRMIGTKHGDWFCVAGDQLGQYMAIRIIGIFPDEPSASVACVKAFYEWIDHANQEHRRLPFIKPPNQAEPPGASEDKAA